MAPVQINVLQVEAFQTRLDTFEDMFPVETMLVDVACSICLRWFSRHRLRWSRSDGQEKLATQMGSGMYEGKKMRCGTLMERRDGKEDTHPGHHDDLFARELQLFDGFAYDDLTEPIYQEVYIKRSAEMFSDQSERTSEDLRRQYQRSVSRHRICNSMSVSTDAECKLSWEKHTPSWCV